MTSAMLRDRLGRIGVWSFRFDVLDPWEAADAAAEIERLDFGCLWVPEVGRTEALSLAAHLLANTSELVVANGIARISDHSASATAAAHRYLDTSSDGRHVLGLGLGGKLSTAPAPLTVMSDYLEEFSGAWASHPLGAERSPVMCLAAYNENMASLAADRTAGVHTYLINEAHTAATRQRIGWEPVIAAEMAVVMTDDTDLARQVARGHLATYLGSAAHQRKFRALGFSDDDMVEGGSDALVDSMIVHGDAAIVGRIKAHHEAGADHVGVQILGTTTLDDDLKSWSHLAGLIADI